jgi:hypothetical protein
VVIGVLFGSIFLILKTKLASIFFWASVFGFVLYRTWVFIFSDRASEAPLTLFLPILIHLIVVFLVSCGLKKGWINKLG